MSAIGTKADGEKGRRQGSCSDKLILYSSVYNALDTTYMDNVFFQATVRGQPGGQPQNQQPGRRGQNLTFRHIHKYTYIYIYIHTHIYIFFFFSSRYCALFMLLAGATFGKNTQDT